MTIIVRHTAFPEVKFIELQVFKDTRGFFFESFHQVNFNAAIAGNFQFVQDNHSFSIKNVVRGLHYQIQRPQGKLVRVISGEIFDVVVDLRRHSPNFGQWIGLRLSAQNRCQLWIPAGFAHGFAVLSQTAECLYKTTDYCYPEYERCIRWDDPTLAIGWPIEGTPILSEKNAMATTFEQAQVYP